jgi:hypothetical protein
LLRFYFTIASLCVKYTAPKERVTGEFCKGKDLKESGKNGWLIMYWKEFWKGF